MVNNSIDLVEMGKRIKNLRKKANKTQKYFADMLFISPSYLTLIEQGKRTVTIDVLAQLAKVCDVSVDYLLFGISYEQTENNYRTFQRLSENYPPHEIKKALRFAEYYLTLEQTTNNT